MMSARAASEGPASLLADLTSSFDHAPWAVIELAGEAHIVRYANSAFCRLIGKTQDEVIGQPFHALLPSADECLALLNRVFMTGMAVSYTAASQETPRPLLFSYHLWPVMAEGRTAGVMIQVNETGPLHETRQAISQALLLGALRQDELIEAADTANAKLQDEINERRQREQDAKVLALEVAHRVKNNLQIVAALIANEIRRAPPPCAEGYRAMQDRIMAIARLYDIMSQSSRERTVALDIYVDEIAKSLSASLLGGASGILIAAEAEPLQIDAGRAVPFGLLVNELATNAVKHAFPDGHGRVTLAVRRLGDKIELTVTDNGVGFEAPGAGDRPGKHGSNFIAVFVRQLGGSIVRSSTPSLGTAVRVAFPASHDMAAAAAEHLGE
jgi:two-component sensor histidine kinase